MIGLNNADNSFFVIDSDDLKFNLGIQYITETIENDIIDFSIVEEIGKITTGTLNLYDPSRLYPSLFSIGLTLKLAWGYKEADTNLRTLLAQKENPEEIGGSFMREGMRAYVMSPSGKGDDKGVSTFSCSFYGQEFSKEKARRIYTVGTKATVVKDVFTRMGVVTSEVNFTRGSETIGEDTQIAQWETDFKFLQRMARDWRCIFRIGYTPAGTLYGVFVDHDKFNLTQFQKATTGAAFGNTIYLDWKYGINNVRSYEWQNHVGDSTGGAHVKMTVINGKTTFVAYIAETETVKAYRFAPEKITDELLRRHNFKSRMEFMKWALSVDDFGVLVKKGYFVPYEESTAPQGLGYSVSVNMLGNPLITPPIEAKFGKGFPDVLDSRQNKLFVKKVTHSINRGGYTCSLEINDTLTYTGGSFVV